MGLITETNAQYYNGEEFFFATTAVSTVTCTLQTKLADAGSTTPGAIANYDIYVSTSGGITPNDFVLYTGVATSLDNVLTFTPAIPAPVAPSTLIAIKLKLKIETKWDNYGSYEYISLNDVINNFLVAYVGVGKLISNVKRTDVMFHAKRGLQEFSYDTLKSVNSQELEITDSLTAVIPQDYVNYVQMSWVDTGGIKHIIYPTQLTSNPTQPLLQDENGMPTQDDFGQNLEAMQSITNQRWDNLNDLDITGQITSKMLNNNVGVFNWEWYKFAYGQRYGLDPVTSNMNGWFTIDQREGKFSFSSNLKNRLIILEYISDGLAYDGDSKVPKMAEEAMYMHIAYSILAGRSNVPEYIVRRFKTDRRAQLRNAKIRLSNIKLDTFIQQMRGKSKWIKH